MRADLNVPLDGDKITDDTRIRAFLERHDDAIEFPIPASWGLAANPGRQILPGELEMDGFYYARIVKQN